MKHNYLIILGFFCLLLPQFLYSQSPNISISYTKPDGLFVCGEDTLSLSILNSGDAIEAGALLSVALPPGLSYVGGSVNGATQQNISNPAAPVFTLPAIANNGTLVVRLLVGADCSAADLLDAGGLFFSTISISGPNINVAVTTTSIAVETGLLLIQSIDTSYLEGERCDTLYRTICVQNTRLGKIGNLHLEDSHPPGIDISVAGAATMLNTPQLFQADFNADLFAGTGNQDEWLDLGETVCITEKIVIQDCGIPQHLIKSQLRLGWGCGMELCRYDSAMANILIKPSTKVPELFFSATQSPITDNCGQTGAPMRLLIKNNGRADATNVSVRLFVPLLTETLSLDPASFQIISSSGVITPITPNLSTPNNDFSCNPATAEDLFINVPLIKPNDSLEVEFKLLACANACDQLSGNVEIQYFYTKACPVNGFVSDGLQLGVNSGPRITAGISMGIGQCLEDGESYPATYKVKSTRLTGSDGLLHVEFTLPHGVTLDPVCETTLAGASPSSVTETPAPMGGTLIHWVYPLPLPSDEMVMDFCLHYECDANIVCGQSASGSDDVYSVYLVDCLPCLTKLEHQSYWTPDLTTEPDCGIGTCSEFELILENCNGGQPPFPTDGVGGIYRWKFETKRLNRGLRDANDDRIADNQETAPESDVRLDRYLPGDTMQVFYCGILDSGILPFLPRNIFHESMLSDVGGAEGNDQIPVDLLKNYFCDASRFRLLRDSMRIHYATGEQVGLRVNDLLATNDKNLVNILVPNSFPNSELDIMGSQKHAFLVSFAMLFSQGLLPYPDLNPGDTIQFFTDFKLGMNLNSPGVASTDPALIGFRTAINHVNTDFAWKIYASQKMQYSGFRLQTTPNTFSIRPCEPSVEVKKFNYSVRIARENLFPREVRPLATISGYQTTVPPGTSVASINLDYLVLQDNVPWIQNLLLPYLETPGNLNIDYGPVFQQPIDEGFSLQTNTTFNANCQLLQPDTSDQLITTSFEGCLNGDSMVITQRIKNTIGYFSNHPRLEFLSSDSILNAASRDFELLFSLKNPFVTGAAFPWISIQSLSGLSTDFGLLRMPQNQPVGGQNGFFNLPQLNGFSSNDYKLTGLAGNCSTDTLLIIFGWDCAPISGIQQTSCYRDTYLVRINLIKPELELDIVEEPIPLELCDTSAYFEFEIFNAKTGYAYEVYGSVKLPSGMSVASGTSQLFYPPAGAWIDMNEPELIAGNVFRWSIDESQAQIAANGLPGIQDTLRNRIRIRFKAITTCGFVANSPIIYGTSGKEACGRSANTLNKPGQPINISGLEPSYGVVISLTPVGTQNPVCGLEQAFNVNVNMLGQASANDSVFVILPAGVSYVTGSYQAGANAPAGPPALTPTGFTLPLPLLPGGGSFQFNFKVVYGSEAGCGDQILLVQSRIHTEAFCATLGAPCDVYVATGEYALNLAIQHPELTASNTTVIVENNQMTVQSTIENIGSYPSQGATAQIWQDVDGDQILSTADVLLTTVTGAGLLSPGANTTLQAVLNYDPAYRCNLLLVLPAAENCACEDLSFPIQVFEIRNDTVQYCNLEPVQVGVTEQSGAVYQWINPADGISCQTCGSAVFTPDSDIQPGVPILLTLQETNGSCITTHRFLISFGAAASINSNNATICQGAQAVLEASPGGQQYLWQGPGILNPALVNQVVQPTSDAQYSLTVTFAGGCTASASTTVSVLPSDSTTLATIDVCEGSIIAVFGMEVQATSGLLSVQLTNTNGCDSVVIQPVTTRVKPVTEAAVTFCEGASIVLFDSTLTASGQVCRTFPAANGCDSTHCISASTLPAPELPAQDTLFSEFGESIELGSFPGFATYTWNPMPNPPCTNCPAITVTPDTAGYFEYTLTVAAQNGCLDTVIWRVVVSPPCDPQNVDIPNAFTPNGDGFNDVFRAVETEGGELIGRLVVYDRWGEKVFENTGNVFWDGTIQGKPAPSDVYVYLIEIICANGKLIKPGEVTLLR